eukprot:m.53179 g.53179  ORF g.53179 m.53179 type:complete len:236 (+) comp34241_c0_seq1:71-778(+)
MRRHTDRDRPLTPIGLQKASQPDTTRTARDGAAAGDDESPNYEDESDVHTAKGLNTNAFRWLLTANARAEMRFQSATTTIDKQRCRVRNAIERQQKALVSKSLALKALLGKKDGKVRGSAESEESPRRPTVLQRPTCPTPSGHRHRRPKSASWELPAVNKASSLQSHSDYNLSRYQTDSAAALRHSMPDIKRSDWPVAKNRDELRLRRARVSVKERNCNRQPQSPVSVFLTKFDF